MYASGVFYDQFVGVPQYTLSLASVGIVLGLCAGGLAKTLGDPFRSAFRSESESGPPHLTVKLEEYERYNSHAMEFLVLGRLCCDKSVTLMQISTFSQGSVPRWTMPIRNQLHSFMDLQ